jgi:hypothetical protein
LKRRSEYRTADGSGTSHEASIRTGVAVEFPEARSKAFDEPQIMVVQMGLVHILAIVVPAKFNFKVLQAGAILWLGLSWAIVLHPTAVILGGHASIGQSLRFGIVVFSYALLLWAWRCWQSRPLAMPGWGSTWSPAVWWALCLRASW